MDKLRCARCGGLLSPTGQGFKDGYKLVPGPEKPGANEYVHEDERRCRRLPARGKKRR